MKKRTVALLLALVLVFGVAVGGTLAWMVSKTAEVRNTFTIGQLEITLDELDIDDSDNDGSTQDRDTANLYENILPGGTYVKDPTVHVTANSADCYVFVAVNNGIAGIEVDATDSRSIAYQMEALGWVPLMNGTTQVTVDGAPVWYYNGDKATSSVVKSSASAVDLVVFNSFTIATNPVKATMNQYKDAAITVVAYAIQADATLNTPLTAWNAGVAQNWA